MDAHRQHCSEHQIFVGEHQARAADDHDPDFGELDDSDKLGLVMVVGKLPGQGREQEEGQDEQPLSDRAELEFLPRVLEQLIRDEQHHRLLEQAVIERAEELGREQGHEAPRAQQVSNVLDQAWAARVVII